MKLKEYKMRVEACRVETKNESECTYELKKTFDNTEVHYDTMCRKFLIDMIQVYFKLALERIEAIEFDKPQPWDYPMASVTTIDNEKIYFRLGLK